MSKVVGLPNNSYKPITNRAWVRSGFVNYNNGCTKLADASDKVYQLLAHSRQFSLGTPASSTTKTGRHDSAEGGVKLVFVASPRSIKEKKQGLVGSESE